MSAARGSEPKGKRMLAPRGHPLVQEQAQALNALEEACIADARLILLCFFCESLHNRNVSKHLVITVQSSLARAPVRRCSLHQLTAARQPPTDLMDAATYIAHQHALMELQGASPALGAELPC